MGTPSPSTVASTARGPAGEDADAAGREPDLVAEHLGGLVVAGRAGCARRSGESGGLLTRASSVAVGAVRVVRGVPLTVRPALREVVGEHCAAAAARVVDATGARRGPALVDPEGLDR